MEWMDKKEIQWIFTTGIIFHVDEKLAVKRFHSCVDRKGQCFLGRDDYKCGWCLSDKKWF